MSVIIIGTGGGGHAAITRLVVLHGKATAAQKTQIEDLINDFTAKAEILAGDIEAN